MPITSRQHQVLADLGITLWQCREKPADAVAMADVSTESHSSAAVEVKGALLVVSNSEMNDDKQRLLGAMLKSVALTPEQVTVLNDEQFQQVSAEVLPPVPVLVLGDAEPVDGMPLYTCPDLDQLLQQPSLKASAWQVLKQIKTAF